MEYLLTTDWHGVYTEAIECLEKAGWSFEFTYPLVETGSSLFTEDETALPVVTVKEKPDNEMLVFLGDMNDRGPATDLVINFWMQLVKQEVAVVLRGNHDDKLMRYLKGNKVNITHGLDMTIKQLDARGEDFKKAVLVFLETLPYKFETEDMICVHAAYAPVPGDTEKVRKEVALYGVVSKEKDDYGYPIRLHNWMEDYTGKKTVYFGHEVHSDITVYSSPNSICIALDTAGVFGGKITSYRHGTGEYFQVQCQEYYKSRNPRIVGPKYVSAKAASTVTAEIAMKEKKTVNTSNKGIDK